MLYEIVSTIFLRERVQKITNSELSFYASVVVNHFLIVSIKSETKYCSFANQFYEYWEKIINGSETFKF